jgi:hypothetical protein
MQSVSPETTMDTPDHDGPEAPVPPTEDAPSVPPRSSQPSEVLDAELASLEAMLPQDPASEPQQAEASDEETGDSAPGPGAGAA